MIIASRDQHKPAGWAKLDSSWILNDMRVQVTRRGGLAGVTLHATLDTAQLSVVDAARAEVALRGLPWGSVPTEPTGADRFRYEVVTEQGDHQRQVELSETEIPDTLRPLLELLPDHGQARSRRRLRGESP